MNILKVKKAIKSYRDKNNLIFGYKILDKDILNENEFISAIIFLNADGSDMETNPITWSNVETENIVLENEAINKEQTKQLALNKLKALGLTEEEVKSIL
jgi:hypothetical protein